MNSNNYLEEIDLESDQIRIKSGQFRRLSIDNLLGVRLGLHTSFPINLKKKQSFSIGPRLALIQPNKL